MRAVLRRTASTAEPEQGGDADHYEFGGFVLDTGAHRLTQGNQTISLTSGEFDLLNILVTHPNKVLDRDRILDLMTGAERSPFDRSIDVRVTLLRAKIEPDPAPC